MAKDPKDPGADNSEGHFYGFDADGALHGRLQDELRLTAKAVGFDRVPGAEVLRSLLREALDARHEKRKRTDGRKK